jgi:uncharacterized protein YjiK
MTSLFSSLLIIKAFCALLCFGTVPADTLPYRLDQPDAVLELPGELKEISGLSMAADGSCLTAVNDERGIIFLLDKSSGAIIREISFGDDGDYEGIEILGKDAWIVKSNGTLYQVKDYLGSRPQVVRHKTFLTKAHDVEGLCYLPNRQQLLLACKGVSFSGSDSLLKKAVYAFDLQQLSLAERPVLLLEYDKLDSHLSKAGGKKKKDSAAGSEAKKELAFSPSGIAVHPVTGEYYLLSARGNYLLVADATGEVLQVHRLDKEAHAQPEGICFDAAGNLYISNEGKDCKAVICKYLYR